MGRLKTHYTGNKLAHQRSLCKLPKVTQHTKDWSDVTCLACLKLKENICG